MAGFVENFKAQAVEARHSTKRSQPNKTLPVLQNATHLPVRQAVLDAEIAGNGQVVLPRGIR